MSVLIIGGGVAGLSCGCYLQMNGYQTEILEANGVPGGLCVAWERGPYLFDGCLKWVLGADPSSRFYRLWNELGALNGHGIVSEHEFLRVEGPNGEAITLTTDLQQLERDLKRLVPEDASRLEILFAAARRCAPLDPPEQPLEIMNLVEKTRLLFRYLPIFMTVGKWKGRRSADYIAGYRNPFLREVLTALVGDSRMSALVLVMMLAWRAQPNAGYVPGGARAFSRAIAERYQELGGRFRFHTQVVSVQVEDHRATGVRCADGTTLPASTVISCADGRTTIFEMLGGRYLNRSTLFPYRNGEVFPGLMQASLGVNLTFPNAPRALNLPLAVPLKVDPDTQHQRLEFSLSGAESELCPPGKTVVIARFEASYKYWAQLKQQDPLRYTQEKQVLLQNVTEICDRRLPGLAAHLEQADLATPATFERYTGNWQGSIQGWLPTPRILGHFIPRTLPGLDRFYMAGHWIEPGGGLPNVALSGRYVAQLICARDKKPFKAFPAWQRPVPSPRLRGEGQREGFVRIKRCPSKQWRYPDTL